MTSNSSTGGEGGVSSGLSNGPLKNTLASSLTGALGPRAGEYDRLPTSYNQGAESGYDQERLLDNDYHNGDSSDPEGGNYSGIGGLHLRIASAVMRRIGYVLACSTILVMVVVVPYVTVQAILDRTVRTDHAAFYSAGAFVLVTVILSTREIYRHLTNWYMPDVQKYVVRILWMVPVYAMQSWLSLRFHGARIYIDTFRDLYEALVIQSFVYYLIELLGGEEALVLILQGKDAHHGEHGRFLGYFFGRRWEMGMEFMLQCKHGVLQYVVVKTVTTLLTALLEPIGLYGEGEFDWRMGYPYISFVMNISVMYALYCLVKLFHATSEELRHPVNWHPLGKFLCVKGVVFFTWWQGILIFFLKAHGIIGKLGNWDAEDVANGLQDYLICVEMFFFAIAHSYTFTYMEYLPAATAASRQRNGTDGIDLFGGAGGFFGAGGNNGRRTSPFATNTGNQVVDYDEDDEDAAYRPPVIRTLHAPMGFRDAFWSSTVPTETISDIQRLRNGVSDEVMSQSTGPGMISMGSIQHAESI